MLHKVKDEEKHIALAEVGEIDEFSEFTEQKSNLKKLKSRLLYGLFALGVFTFIYLSINLYEASLYFRDLEESPDFESFVSDDHNLIPSNVREEFFITDAPEISNLSNERHEEWESKTPENEKFPINPTEEEPGVPVNYDDTDDYPLKQENAAAIPEQNHDPIKLALI